MEGVLALGVAFLTLSLGIELIRTAQQAVLIRHSCFLYVRLRSLGLSEDAVGRRISNWIAGALGTGALGNGVLANKVSASRRWLRQTAFEYGSPEYSARVQSRYASLFLPYRDPAIAADAFGPRDRLQFTQRCYFSLKTY